VVDQIKQRLVQQCAVLRENEALYEIEREVFRFPLEAVDVKGLFGGPNRICFQMSSQLPTWAIFCAAFIRRSLSSSASSERLRSVMSCTVPMDWI
jgi:hypothetical protein